MWIWLLLLSLAAAGSIAPAWPADSVLPKGGEAQPVSTTITAKKMTVRNQDSQAVFEGSVILTRGALLVYSDKMVVLFRPQNGDVAKTTPDKPGAAPSKGQDTMPAVSNRSVNRIEATGHVKIERENGNATCDKAVYFNDEEKIVLTGNPVAWEKGTRVSGKQITMYLAEDRSVVEGGSHVRIDSEGESPR